MPPPAAPTRWASFWPSFLRRATLTNEKSSAKALSRSARKNNATGCCTRRHPTGEPRFRRHIDPRKRHLKSGSNQKSATHSGHSDILQVNVIGTYFDLTRKVTAASTGSTAVARKPVSSYDHVYVHVHNLMAVFKSSNSFREFFYGTSADGLVRRGKQ